MYFKYNTLTIIFFLTSVARKNWHLTKFLQIHFNILENLHISYLNPILFQLQKYSTSIRISVRFLLSLSYIFSISPPTSSHWNAIHAFTRHILFNTKAPQHCSRYCVRCQYPLIILTLRLLLFHVLETVRAASTVDLDRRQFSRT